VGDVLRESFSLLRQKDSRRKKAQKKAGNYVQIKNDINSCSIVEKQPKEVS
jgi:hypothetical protein